jgi:hypothetical protein
MDYHRLISAFEQSPDDQAMGRLVTAAVSDQLADEDVAELAQALARSGSRLPRLDCAADIASTGGPSSLSTLICPLQLRARGLIVPKLGVAGRPAGGVDVLQTIPGYRAALELDEARRGLDRSGYVHLLADERWATLDARLFAYRQREGSQSVPVLVIASILAKKLAAGATGAGLEVRVASHGNFGVDVEHARVNARRFGAVARLLDLAPVCALTDASRPYQPYIGRGEALVALDDVMSGRARGWLAEHESLCLDIADAVARALGFDVTEPPTPSQLRGPHDALLVAHGSTPAAFDARVEAVRRAPRTSVRSDRAGLVRFDLGRLRDLLVARQRADGVRATGMLPDPAGVILGAPGGAHVEVGREVISIRAPDGEDGLVRELAACVAVRDGAPGPAIATSNLEFI